MSPLPATPSSTASSSTSSLTKTDATPKNDHRILIVVIILGILATFLIAYIVYITMRLKRRQTSGENMGPYQGTATHQDHPAANITPFGAVGPDSGGQIPRFKHNPGEEMRIAIRLPDGAWHFTDSRTPFAPAGVSEIDVAPSPTGSYSASLLSFNSSSYIPSSKAKALRDQPNYDDADFGFEVSPFTPPPPAYYREPCRQHYDDRHSPA